MEYKYRVDGLQKVPAQVAGEMCERLENSNGGLTAKTLLDANRTPSAPLHGEFDWNDTEAAEKYRLTQAQGIIRNILIVRPEIGEEKVVRAFVNVCENHQRSYVGIARVMDDDELREDLLLQAKSDMLAFIKKYSTLNELQVVLSEMHVLLAI